MNKLDFYVSSLSSLGTPGCKQFKRCLSSTKLSKPARQVDTLPLQSQGTRSRTTLSTLVPETKLS